AASSPAAPPASNGPARSSWWAISTSTARLRARWWAGSPSAAWACRARASRPAAPTTSSSSSRPGSLRKTRCGAGSRTTWRKARRPGTRAGRRPVRRRPAGTPQNAKTPAGVPTSAGVRLRWFSGGASVLRRPIGMLLQVVLHALGRVGHVHVPVECAHELVVVAHAFGVGPQRHLHVADLAVEVVRRGQNDAFQRQRLPQRVPLFLALVAQDEL